MQTKDKTKLIVTNVATVTVTVRYYHSRPIHDHFRYFYFTSSESEGTEHSALCASGSVSSFNIHIYEAFWFPIL